MLDQFYVVTELRPDFYGLKNLDFSKESIKILGVHISYNRKLQNDINFCTAVKNICNLMKLWCISHLSLEDKTTTFKSFAISKIVYLALLTIVSKHIIKELNEIQKKCLWSNKKRIIKHGTLCNNYKNGGLKNVDVKLKRVSWKSVLWIRILCDEFHHDWKIIPLNYINNALDKNFKFHSNLSIPNKTINFLPSWYKDIIDSWFIIRHYYYPLEAPTLVSSQFRWFSSYIKIDNKIICYKVSNLFEDNGKLKSLHKMINDFQLIQKTYFEWFQLIHPIPKSWKLAVLNNKGNSNNIIYLKQHLI